MLFGARSRIRGNQVCVISVAEPFEIRHSSFTRHISPPNEPADQLLPGALRASRRIDGACHLDAATKERRSRRSVWRRRHRKHFRRANHERPCEVHHVAGRYIFRTHVCVIGPLCAPQRCQQCLPSRTDENAATANLTCPCGSTNITGVVICNYAGRGFAGCFSSGECSADGFAKIVARGPFGNIGLVATALREVFPYMNKASAKMERPATRWLQLQRN